MDWSRTHGRNRTVEVRKDKDMKYPMINKQPRREVNVPQLSGGLNLRDSLTGIRDNQMTDCINMWYKEGMLRTRPGFVTNEEMKLLIENNDCIQKIKTYPNVRKGDAVLSSCWRFDGEQGYGNWQSLIEFWWQYDNKIEYAGNVFIELGFDWTSEESLQEAIDKCSCFVSAKDGIAYCFASNGNAYYINKLDYVNGASKWEEVSNDEIYAPIVYHHCLMTIDGYTATQFEGYNLIGNRYRAIFSTVNRSLFNESITEIPMKYYVPGIEPNKSFDGKIIVAKITYKDKVVEHKVVFENGNNRAYEEEPPKDGDGLVMVALANNIWFEEWHAPEEGYEYFETKKLTEDDYIEDNLEITVSYEKNYNTEDEKVFGMTQSAWFGGAANGINGGSRLFLCGNTDEKEKSLVVWSSLNNPLYFPENNYAYVGDKSQGVTAFGQQGENLIIFKEKSTYYSYYNVNDNITADDIINQSVVDYEANSAIFPMIQLNANIGCDCPDTVQLCRNRLVWANSDGNVYTLYSNNQYSERTIYKISDMINSMLKKENDLKNAISCDFEGHYLLCVGNKIYVMDYNSYGYQYAASFSKNEDSNVQIPWYIWETSDVGYVGKLFEMNNRLMLMYDYDTSDGVMLTFSTLSADENTANDNILIFNQNDEIEIIEKKIKSKLQTKLFDFSAAGYLKNVDRVSIAFGNNGGEPISVNFVSDAGCENESVMLAGSATDERDAAFVTAKNFYPGMKSVRTFGVKIECEGPLIVDGLSLQYRLLGSVK